MTKRELIQLKSQIKHIPDSAFENGKLTEFNTLHSKLAFATFKDVSSATAELLWEKAWGEMTNVHLPEVKYNHDLRYIDSLLGLLEEKE